MEFITKEKVSEKPAILELVQHDGGSVELVVRASMDSPSYCLGFFTNGALRLCAVDQAIMESMGILYCLHNAAGVKLSVKYS